jgi:hypothetical protein
MTDAQAFGVGNATAASSGRHSHRVGRQVMPRKIPIKGVHVHLVDARFLLGHFLEFRC